MKDLLKRLTPFLDPVVALLAIPAALLLWAVRETGLHRLPTTRRMLLKIGVLPIRDHYYEPQFDFRNPRTPFSTPRALPGIDWNTNGQLELLKELVFADEIRDVPTSATADREFHFGNGSFESGDAEFLYQLIRARKPRRIYEIGSGYSTLMAIRAVTRNRLEDEAYECEHVCIEPYEMPWLEATEVRVLREKVEDVDPAFFGALEENDLLFIDSSHVIRPQGDVLVEYLQLLPTLAPGVIVHVHDIFSPRDYLDSWLKEEVKLWNEQYLLEAFLTHNEQWEVIGALNYLHHLHPEELSRVAPFLTADREPGSFYIRRLRG